MNLIIVGNGFDINHGLQTAYLDFKNFIKDKKNDLFTIDVLDTLYDLGEDWCDFEEGLGRIKETEKANQTIKILGNMGITAITDILQKHFQEWVHSLCLVAPNKYRFNKNDLFFSFNYTHTLENVYNVPINNIKYIHGCVADGLFGFGQKIKYGHSIGKSSSDPNRQALLTETEKNVREIIKQNESYFGNLKNVETIKIFGHSYSDIDFPYFERIDECVKGVKWEFGEFKPKDIQGAKFYMERLGIDQSRGRILPSEELFEKTSTK